jgi:hypothetical protein
MHIVKVHHVQVRHWIPDHVTEMHVVTEEPRAMVDVFACLVGQEPAARGVSEDEL